MFELLTGPVDLNYFCIEKMHDKALVIYCVQICNIASVSSFVPAIIKKVGGAWIILDGNEDKLIEQVSGTVTMGS